VYPGVWAICAINRYTFNDPRKKGVAFGLQSVMIIGDDTALGGGAPDPSKTMAAARGIAAPIVRPDVARGMPTSQQPPQPAGIPGYTAPSGAPGAPVPRVPAGAVPHAYAAPQMPGRPVQHQPYLPPSGAPDDDED